MAVRRMSAMGQKDVHFSPARPSDAMKGGGWRRGEGVLSMLSSITNEVLSKKI